ncbi:DUF4249 domain-containing protein [Pontibacter flavimaris]|uniref:DUF4249 domain-containing protein n=1 Tax=Pontibacter flavimaris TaxID=1797110 RepID=A0A1Q5PEP8_9BACT|nr:DUF4249 domain-containing protein [Pontibacter flavimaris]OKL40663.1 hypothetical protein A3841_12440 [Pontibacter flavimaris]
MMRLRTERKSWLWAPLLAILCLQACVEPFELETGTEKQSLVVDGLITDRNDTTLNKVTLSWTAPYNGVDGVVVKEPVSGASVMLYDNKGNLMQFRESYSGNYVLDESEYDARPGESYTLRIWLPDGREYASRPELLTEAPPIRDLGYTYKEFIEVVKNGSGELVEQTELGFEVRAEVDDPANAQNFYRWSTKGILEYHTIALEIKDPPPSTCWSCQGRINKTAVAADDAQVNGNKISQLVAVVPADIPTRYQATVQQFSLTPAAFEFWRLLQQQQTSVGSIFDPPPARIRGNLYNASDPEEEVYGYFGASGVAEKSLIIDRVRYYPFPRRGPYEVPMSDFRWGCLLLNPNSTSIRPPGF